MNSGTYERRLRAARRVLKSWGYRLVKSRAIIVHEGQTNAFAVVDIKSGKVVAGGKCEAPRLSLSEVEDWYNAQNFPAKIASDGTLLRDVSPTTMTPALADVVARVAMLRKASGLSSSGICWRSSGCARIGRAEVESVW